MGRQDYRGAHRDKTDSGIGGIEIITFDQLKKAHPWRQIPNCFGRFVLLGGPCNTTLAELVGIEIPAQRLSTRAAKDAVWIAKIAGGGLISYEKEDGRFIHTLNTETGFTRKLEDLAIEFELEVRISPAVTDQDILDARALFIEYEKYLSIDLEFQQFDSEIEALPGQYTPPRGCLLLAREGGSVIGTASLRPLSTERCEMKRLFVPSNARGKGIGLSLASAIIAEAHAAGYKTLFVDTLSRLKDANALYEALGFKRTEPYTHNPHEDAVFLELDLAYRSPR